MAIELKREVRKDPFDFEPDVAYGVSLPFSSTSVFNQTYTKQEQIKFNLLNLLLTSKGERFFNPTFGTDLRKVLFDNNVDTDILTETITADINTWIPDITVNSITANIDADNHILGININYSFNLNGEDDTVTINFI
jgi:phage baseplate assembly protein W